MHTAANKRLLLLAHAWCPRGGVRTRRWSKLAKYLSRSGVHVDVVTSHYPYTDKVNWCHDISNNPLIVTYPTAGGYPTYLLKPRRNLLVKIGTRILSRTTHPIDAAQRWFRSMNNKCVELISQHNYDAVILTVGPFSPLLNLPHLKAQFPNTLFVIDYRDPWSYYQKAVTTSTPAEIAEDEYQVLQQLDQIWVTTKDHLKAYADKFPLISDKLRVLSNGYDPEEMKNVIGSKISEDNWTAIHPGSLAGKRLDSLFVLLAALQKVNIPILQERFRIHLYSSNGIPYEKIPKALLATYDHYVSVNHPVPARAMLQLIANSRFGLLLDDKDHRLTIPTKTFEYLALDKKVIFIGPEKDISQKLSVEGHYQARVNEASVCEMLIKLTEEETSGSASKKNKFKEQFRIDSLATQLLSFL